MTVYGLSIPWYCPFKQLYILSIPVAIGKFTILITEGAVILPEDSSFPPGNYKFRWGGIALPHPHPSCPPPSTPLHPSKQTIKMIPDAFFLLKLVLTISLILKVIFRHFHNYSMCFIFTVKYCQFFYIKINWSLSIYWHNNWQEVVFLY